MSEEPQNQITPSEPTALLEPIAPAQEDQFGLQPSTEDVEMDLPSEAPRQIHEPALNIAFDGPADDPRITDEGANQNIRNLPSKKDITLRELLNKMDDFAPIVRIVLPN